MGIPLPVDRLRALQLFPGSLQLISKLVEMALKVAQQLGYIGNSLLMGRLRLFRFLPLRNIVPSRLGLAWFLRMLPLLRPRLLRDALRGFLRSDRERRLSWRGKFLDSGSGVREALH